jgi:hypothetical protein
MICNAEVPSTFKKPVFRQSNISKVGYTRKIVVYVFVVSRQKEKILVYNPNYE